MSTPPTAASSRSGAVLIVVAAMSALLATMALAFLMRQRSSAEDSILLEQDVQARIMLIAACNYIQEGSRIGYDDGVDPFHREAFGWVDVREVDSHGAPVMGPNCRGASPSSVVPLFDATPREVSGRNGSSVDRPAWPALFAVARCPMYVMVRPPYAVQLTTAYNPIASDPANPAFGRPYLTSPDPMPVVVKPMSTPTALNDYLTGDLRARVDSTGRSWFRVYRDGMDTFVITCGAGGSLGFNNWNEVLGAGAGGTFNNDHGMFLTLLDQEVRLWYRVQWSAAVATPEVHNIKNSWVDNLGSVYDDYYVSFPMNSSQSIRSQSHCKNMGGTFRYIERLRYQPTNY
jgi:hypothetical protein